MSVAVTTGFEAIRACGDQFLLHVRHFFERDLHAQIAARHHDAVEGVDDLGGLAYCFGPFDLGQDRHFEIVNPGNCAQFMRRRGIADKRQAEPIDARGGSDGDGFAIPACDGGNVEFGVRKIDALVGQAAGRRLRS